MPDDEAVCGLANAYSRDCVPLTATSQTPTASGGTGGRNVLDAAVEERLQVLTHPEW